MKGTIIEFCVPQSEDSSSEDLRESDSTVRKSNFLQDNFTELLNNLEVQSDNMTELLNIFEEYADNLTELWKNLEVQSELLNIFEEQ